MNLRPAIPADLPFLMDLERACPSAAHWTEEQYRQAIGKESGGPERLVLVAEGFLPAGAAAEGPEPRSGILGLLVAQHVAGEWELENIVVSAAARRRGLGGQLMAALLGRAKEAQSEAVFLEVRESNTAARKLYEKTGFKETGRRKFYYADPPESALVYRLDLRE